MKNKMKYIAAVSAASTITFSAFAADADAGNEKPQSWWERESPVLEEAANRLLPDSGFTPVLTWTGETWSSLSGGLKHGTIFDSLITFGFEQDIEKLSGVKNAGRIGLTAFYYAQSGNFENYLSGMSAASNIFSGKMTRVFEIYYANEFETGAGNFAFRVGQLAADEDFMGLDYADVFLNSSFGAIPVNADLGLANGRMAFSQYSLATFGATAEYAYEDFSIKLGLYNGDAGDDVASNHGFDYNLHDVAFWYALSYNYSIAGLGGTVVFGGNLHTGEFENLRNGGTAANFYSFYLAIQQDLLCDDEGNPILGAFCRLAYTPSSEIATYSKYIDAGLNWFAPFKSRPDDILALGVSAVNTTKNARNYAENEGERLGKYETCVELTYKCQITKSFSVQPDLQMYFYPESRSGDRQTSLVFGARAELNF